MDSPELNRVAETHFFVRPLLKSALASHVLTLDARTRFPDCETYLDVWKGRMSDKFFDMGTLIRAAASVETSLRDYYMIRKGYTTQVELRRDPRFSDGMFQRILPRNGRIQAADLFNGIGVDILQPPVFPRVQELMLHRHLYAHNLGVIDDKYIRQLRDLTGRDLLADPTVNASYPASDVVWFEPLSRITEFIEAVREFLRALP